jgi:asparagine synthetase B (glutamine-hydrolysing)
MSAICGMIGNYARRGSAEAELAAMQGALAFRAPDDATTWHDPEGGALLGFRCAPSPASRARASG